MIIPFSELRLFLRIRVSVNYTIKKYPHKESGDKCWKKYVIINNMTIWNKIYTYNKKTGLLKRKGRVVGCKDYYGYLIVGHQYKLYKVHRIIWEMMNGEIPENMVVDHINQNPSDNRISNLRLATKAQNAYNSKIRKDSKYNTTGVSWKKDKNKYKAYITINKKQKHLGYFDSLEDAISARKKEEALVLDF